MTYINAHLDEKITVQSIADAVFVSTRMCYRMFREYLHIAPNEYIRSCRIRKACVLLNRDKVSVTEAAQRCGFDDSSYFARVFREMTGYTPLEFKKMAQQSLFLALQSQRFFAPPDMMESSMNRRDYSCWHSLLR